MKVTAGVAGVGVLAGLLGGIGIGRSEAASGGSGDPEVISSGPGGQVGTASVIVFQDSSGNNYAIDRGAGLSSTKGLVGALLVNANVTTTYYNTLTGKAAGTTTQTAGIQEAIQTVYALGGGIIYMSPGWYDVTNAPFQQDPNSSGTFYQIGIPVTSSNPGVYIAIVSLQSAAIDAPSGATFTKGNYGLPIIYSGADGLSNSYLLMYGLAPASGINYTRLFLDGIILMAKNGNTLSGLNTYNLASFNAGRISISGTSASGYVNGYAIQWPGSDVSQFIEALGVFGYEIGIVANDLMHIGNYFIYGTNTAISGGGTNFVIDYMDVQGPGGTTSYIIDESGLGSSDELRIRSLWLGDYSGNWTYHVYDPNKHLSGAIDELVYRTGSPLSVSTSLYVVGGGFKVRHLGMLLSWSGLSISVNPPVSGTPYLNSSPVNIRLSVPITLNPTSAAAATAYLRVGSSSTAGANPITDQVNFPAGLTTVDGAIYTLKYVVPAGQYFEVDATNATIGTAQVDEAE